MPPRRAAGAGDLGRGADEERDGARGRAVVAGQRRGVGDGAAEVGGRRADLRRDVGGTQVLKLPRAKSLSWASVSCDERVSARKLPKHGGVAAEDVGRG